MGDLLWRPAAGKGRCRFTKTRGSLARDRSGWGGSAFPEASGGHQQLGAEAEAPSLTPLLLGGAGAKVLALSPAWEDSKAVTVQRDKQPQESGFRLPPSPSAPTPEQNKGHHLLVLTLAGHD